MITVDLIKELFNYDPATGVFTWKKPTNYKVKIGQKAGWMYQGSRYYLSIKNVNFPAAQAAWMYVHGEAPDVRVMPINGDLRDCRLANLGLSEKPYTYPTFGYQKPAKATKAESGDKDFFSHGPRDDIPSPQIVIPKPIRHEGRKNITQFVGKRVSDGEKFVWYGYRELVKAGFDVIAILDTQGSDGATKRGKPVDGFVWTIIPPQEHEVPLGILGLDFLFTYSYAERKVN